MLVTEWGPETPGAKGVLDEFRKNHKKDLENFDLIPISITMLHTIGSWLCDDYEFKTGEKKITEENVKAVFRALADGACEFEEGAIKKSMDNTWCDVLEACWEGVVWMRSRRANRLVLNDDNNMNFSGCEK